MAETGLRYFRDRIVVGARAVGTVELFDSTASNLLVEVGVQRMSGSMNTMLLLTGGMHTIYGLGSGIVTSSDASPVRLSCLGFRARSQTHRDRLMEWGINLSVLADLGRRDVAVKTTGIFASSTLETYRVGGWIVGLSVDMSFGDPGR